MHSQTLTWGKLVSKGSYASGQSTSNATVLNTGKLDNQNMWEDVKGNTNDTLH